MAKRATQSRRRYVDMWALPSLHPSNVELLQQLKTADTQHFTKSMDVVGTVSECDTTSGVWEKTHLVGLRTDVWKPSEDELKKSLRVIKKKRLKEIRQSIKRSGKLNQKQAALLEDHSSQDRVMNLDASQIENRRLVLKLFKNTGQRVRWCGTIEEVTTSEIHNSIGSKRCLLTTAIMLPGSPYVTYVQQNHRTFRIPSLFTFCFFDDERMWHLSLKQRWFSLGIDFDIEVDGQPMGNIDGRLISFGCDSYVNLGAHHLSDDTQFVDLLTLFTASVGYHRAMRKSLRRRVKATKAGESHRHIIEDEELRLRHNGRAAA